MKASVLINNYNYAQYLGAAIDSALAQDYPDLEVVVVDDGSTDASRAVIASYGEGIVPVLKANGGQASSFNAGFAASHGDLIFLLDADDAFLPGKLARVAAIYERLGIDWCFDRVTTDAGAAGSPTEPVVTPFDKRDRLRQGKFPSLPVPTSGLSFRRDALAKILPMPVAADVVLSDNYLKFAAAYLGRGALVETPLTFQRLHASNRYTGGRAGLLRPRIMVETGLELARRYAGLKALGTSLVAGGLAEGELPPSRLWAEIRRCTRDGTFGAGGAARIAALVAGKRLARRLRPRREALS